MIFLIKDIPKNRLTVNPTVTKSSSYTYGGGSTVGYLELFEKAENIKNGIIKKNTLIGGTHGTVTGDSATYFNQLEGSGNGWIFSKTSTTGETINIASIDESGNVNINGLNIINGINKINLSVDASGKLKIDGDVYSTGEVSSYGAGDGSGGDGGLIQMVYDYEDLAETFDNGTLTDTFNAYTIKKINDDLNTKVDEIKQDKNFKFYQNMPAITWNIQHNLNKYPALTVIDSAGTICEGAVQYIDNNNISITFSYAFSGVVLCN